MTIVFNDVYGVLEIVAAQVQGLASLEEEENSHLFNLLDTAKPNVKNQVVMATALEKNTIALFF